MPDNSSTIALLRQVAACFASRPDLDVYVTEAELWVGTSIPSTSALRPYAVCYVAAHNIERYERSAKGGLLGAGAVVSQAKGGSVNFSQPLVSTFAGDQVLTEFSTTPWGQKYLAIRARHKRVGAFVLNGSGTFSGS